MTALRALLAGIVDYAGLFPPAALDMPTAVRNYAKYRASGDAWMLGRFVVPAQRLGELAPATADAPNRENSPWRLSALIGAQPDDDLRCIADFERAHGERAIVDSLEAKATDEPGIERLAALASAKRSVFVEIPVDRDPAPLVKAIAHAGLSAKIRTGGVTPDAFPAADSVLRFMRCCTASGVPFKATAGLHHPVRATYPLTYAPNAPTSPMFGFLNVFLAAAAIAQGAADGEVLALLAEAHPEAFAVSRAAIAWRERRFAAAELRAVRDRVALSFGSCSFREPVDDLRTLGLLGTE